MPGESVGIKTGISIKKQTVDESGNVKKTTFFFPDLNTSVEATDVKEARRLAEEKTKQQQL